MLQLYERILEQTKKNDITGKQLAKLLGLKKSPLTDWKNEKSNPTLEQLMIICEKFAISSDYLLFGNTPPPAKTQQELISEDEEILLNNFRQLSEQEQAELKELIEFKLYRNMKNEQKNLTKSSPEQLLSNDQISSNSKTG